MKAVAAFMLIGATSSYGGDDPKLTVNSKTIQQLPPGLAARGFGVRYDFTAVLDGDINDPKTYYCLDEVWDWGDGTDSVHEPDCDPYEDGVELKKTFYDNHVFGRGTFYVTFVLMDGDEIVLKGEKQILIP